MLVLHGRTPALHLTHRDMKAWVVANLAIVKAGLGTIEEGAWGILEALQDTIDNKLALQLLLHFGLQVGLVASIALSHSNRQLLLASVGFGSGSALGGHLLARAGGEFLCRTSKVREQRLKLVVLLRLAVASRSMGIVTVMSAPALTAGLMFSRHVVYIYTYIVHVMKKKSSDMV